MKSIRKNGTIFFGAEPPDFSPAVSTSNGSPAVLFGRGKSEWKKDGLDHRDDGPSGLFPDGQTLWYREGRFYGRWYRHEYEQIDPIMLRKASEEVSKWPISRQAMLGPPPKPFRRPDELARRRKLNEPD